MGQDGLQHWRQAIEVDGDIGSLSDETAPPDPEQSEITSPRRVVTRQQSTAPPAAVTGESSRAEEPTRTNDSAEVESLDSELLLLLQGDLSHFAGAVRCYVDGKFVGQADENGRMRVPIQSGNRYIEIWDSRGRWEAEIVAIAGQTATVTIRSEDRGGEGLY